MSSTKSKKHAAKSKYKSRSRYVSSSSDEDQPSVAEHRSSKPSGAQPSGANSDQDQPKHDPDPPYYREVALADIPSQYAEEVDTFRSILSLPDPRESMPRSSTSVMGLDSVSSQGALEISSVTGQPPSLDRSHCSALRLVAKSLKRDERCRPSSQRPQYPTLYRHLKQRLGRSLRSKFYKGSVVRTGKKATHKHPRIEGGRSFKDQCQNQTVLVTMDNSTGVPTDLSKVVHTSCRLICHSSEPQTSTVHISCPRPKGLGHRCQKLDLCLLGGK